MTFFGRDLRRGTALAAFLALAASPLLAQGRIWRPDERVLITEFHELGGVAVDGPRVYAASPSGLEIYDAAAAHFELPSTEEDGYPVGELPTALAFDLATQELWLGTMSGRLYAFQPLLATWQSRGFVTGPVVQIRFPRSSILDPVYIRIPGGWLTVERGGGFTTPLPPGEGPPPEAGMGSGGLPDDPYFRAQSGTLTLDRAMRRWPISSVARGERPGEYWIATEGGNLFHYSDFVGGAEQIVYGLVTRGAGAVLPGPDGVWFGGDGRGPRRGIARSDPGLRRWEQWESRFDGAPAGRVYDLASAHGGLWVAAEDGLYRWSGDRGWARLLEGEGVPSADTRTVLPVPGGLWVGTRTGARFFSADGLATGPTVLPAARIHALARRSDTLWIAGDAGLAVAPLDVAGAPTTPDPGGSIVTEAPGVAAQPALRGRVVGVTAEPGRVFAATEEALHILQDGGWSGPLRDASAAVGRLRHVALDGGQLWVAGEGGAGRWDVDADLWTFYLAGGDLPLGPAWHVAPAGEHVWVSGPYGAFRLAWRR